MHLQVDKLQVDKRTKRALPVLGSHHSAISASGPMVGRGVEFDGVLLNPFALAAEEASEGDEQGARNGKAPLPGWRESRHPCPLEAMPSPLPPRGGMPSVLASVQGRCKGRTTAQTRAPSDGSLLRFFCALPRCSLPAACG
jgi:hypothetical protein